MPSDLLKLSTNILLYLTGKSESVEMWFVNIIKIIVIYWLNRYLLKESFRLRELKCLYELLCVKTKSNILQYANLTYC